MVDAGRVIFQVGIDRASADRAISQLEQRFAGVGDIDLKIPDAGPAARAARTVQDAFSNIQIPEFNFSANTQQLSRSVQSAKDELLTLEQAIEGLQRQRINVEFKVARGDADLAGIESRIERLNRRKLEIPLVTPGAATEIRKIEADIAKLEARRIKVDADTGDARAQLNQLDRTLEGLSGDDAAQTLKRLQSELNSTARAANQAEKPIGDFNFVLQAFRGAAAFAALDRLVDLFGELTSKVTEFVAASIQANRSLRATNNVLSIVLGSQDAAAESIDFLREVSERTGQSFQALQTEYAGLTAAAAEAGVPQQQVNDLFAETSRVLAIFGKDSVSTGLAFNALTQIASKGVVSMEELRQQLGEQLPVAFGAVARGLGITTAELNDLVSSGNLTASEFIPAFTRGLAEIEGEAPAAQQAIAALENEILGFQQQLGASLEPLETAFSNTFGAIFSNVDASALDPLTQAGERLRDSLADNPELAERLGEALTSFANSGAEAVATILDRITQTLENPENIELFAQSIENLGQGISDFTSDAISLLDAVLSLIDGLERLGLASSLEDVVNGRNQSIGSIANQLNDIEGRRVNVGFDGQFDGPLSRLLGIADTGVEVEANVRGLGAAAEVDLSFVEAFRQASDQVAENDEQAARRAAQERVKANEEAAKEFEEAQKEALANIDIAQQNRIAAVRQNQAAGNISEEQADAQVSEIESDAIRERIQLREDEIAKIEDFASRQVISEKDATDQIRAAREEIADLTLESIESEIDAQDAAREAAEKKAEAAKKAALEQLDAQQRLNDLQAQQVSIQSGIASTALQDQANLIGAQVSLEQSRLSLSRQTLEGKLAEAEAAEDVVAVEEIRDRLLLNQRRSIQAEFNARRQQLQIQQQLTQLDADRQLRLGEIAEAEARIAVERARAAGASADEIQALQQIVSLREQETQALQNQAQVKKDILSIQFEQLDADQELANQRATQERREQAIASSKEQQKNLADEQLQIEKDIASETERRERATSSIVSALAGLSDISSDDALGSLDQLEENARTARRTGALDTDQFRQLQGAIDQAQRFGRSGDGFSVEEAFRFAENNANNPFAAGILDQVGLGGVSSLLDSQQEIAIADSQIERLTNGLTEIKEAIENSPAGIESLTVSTPDPVADAAQITADLTRQQQIAEGVI